MMKKLISMVLAVAITCSLALPAMAAETFPDLKNHWARENMLDLVDRGLLTGDSQGNMNPDKETTTLEALVMLSRFYQLDDDATDWVHDTYGEWVAEYIDPALKWAYDELEICLAAKIVSQQELLSQLSLTSSINKQTLSVFLVRTMQMLEDAKNVDIDLTFDDVDDIAKGSNGKLGYYNYVAVLVDNGIVNGDNNNKFNPLQAVTRAVVAAMMSRSLDLLEGKDVTLDLDAYQPTTARTGRLVKASGKTIQIRDYTGVVFQYTCAEDVKVTENGASSSLGTTQYGYPVTLQLREGVVVSANVEKESDTQWVQGLMTSYSTTALYYNDLANGASVKLNLADKVAVTYNGQSAEMGVLAKNTMVTMKVEDNKVTEIYGMVADYELLGTISALTMGATVEMKVTDDTGVVFVLSMPMANMPDIYRGSLKVDVDRLVLGDDVKVTVSNGTVAVITTTVQEGDLVGTITGISVTADGTTWMITDEDGKTHTLALDSGAVAYSGEKTISVSSLAIGDVVEVTLYGDEITAIYLMNSISATNKITATVLVADSAKKEITAQMTNGSLVYINTSKAGAVILASTGKSKTLSSMEEGDKLVAYGKYTEGNQFQAATVIIED